MTAWLVTGGAGFIGANFARLAARVTDAPLVILDDLTYAGNLANIAELTNDGRVTFVKGNICDETLVDALFARHHFHCVAHFAAESHVDRSILGPRPFIQTNVEGTYVLLEAARNHWSQRTEGKVFLHVSTDEVYGSLEPDESAFTESSPYKPSSPYSASKAAADHLVRAWWHTYGLPVIISNCSNNYGPLQFPEKLLPLMIMNAIDEREMPIYGDGRQVRDWLHVEDHCRALALLIQHGRPGHTYVIGGGCERENIQVVRLVCREVDRLMGRNPGSSERLLRNVADRPGHDRRYAMNAAKLRAELGWQPQHTLEESLPLVVSWYHENRAWVDSIRSGQYLEYYDMQYGRR